MSEFAAMPPREAQALLETAASMAAAMALQPDAQGEAAHRVLRGKNVALLCNASVANDQAAALFQRSACALGAHVAQLRPSLNDASTPTQVAHTAKVLGRLYDGIECLGLSTELVGRIGAAAGVPVFEGLSSDSHPTAHLAQHIDTLLADGDTRCAVVQAVLVSTLAG